MLIDILIPALIPNRTACRIHLVSHVIREHTIIRGRIHKSPALPGLIRVENAVVGSALVRRAGIRRRRVLFKQAIARNTSIDRRIPSCRDIGSEHAVRKLRSMLRGIPVAGSGLTRTSAEKCDVPSRHLGLATHDAIAGALEHNTRRTHWRRPP